MAKLDAYFGEYGGQYVPQILVPAPVSYTHLRAHET